MFNYLYDGSFEGLLTALHDAVASDEKPGAVVHESDAEALLFIKNITITASPSKSDKMINFIIKTMSLDSLHNIFRAFLSDRNRPGEAIYEYIKAGLIHGRRVDSHICDERVRRVHDLRDSVSYETHRLLGLLRFSLTAEGIYYAKIEPDNNITGLLAPHFAKRLPDERWLIHDIGRGTGAFYDKNEWSVSEIGIDSEPEFSNEEIKFRGLWKTFFRSVAIESRINPKLQRRCMPKRYWKHMIEMN